MADTSSGSKSRWEWIYADDPQEEIRLNTQNYNDVLERFVLEHPEQWFWAHRRWKYSRDKRTKIPILIGKKAQLGSPIWSG